MFPKLVREANFSFLISDISPKNQAVGRASIAHLALALFHLHTSIVFQLIPNLSGNELKIKKWLSGQLYIKT
jgi:hypothetical protein